jgi:glucoamylase
MRDIPVGNGSLLVNFDETYRLRDVYFPHVGQENHTEGEPSRFGVWVDGSFSWVDSDGWERSLKYLNETLVTDVTLVNDDLGIEIVCNDTVASHENIYLRRIRVTNLLDTPRNVRIFLHHDFRIYENAVGDTAFYDPQTEALIHYKKHRFFLIDTEPHFDAFATGRKAFGSQEGTWRDAEDGELHGGAITEGSVDSTIGVHFTLEANASFQFYYWIAAGTSYKDVFALNALMLEQRPERFLDHTENYWRAWVNKNETRFDGLPPEIVELYKRSLLIVRTQIDNGGAILAANDSDVVKRATDHYSYLWTRDGAFVAHALDLAGYPSLARRFYEFCGKIVNPDGYFFQKYNADGTIASSWHPLWDAHRQKRLLPIQEDETALVLWAFWQHYRKYRNIEFAHALYRPLVVACADFMMEYRDTELRLPKASWNLWEDRRGIHTFTCSTVVAGLRAAANFARLFADSERAAAYDFASAEVCDAMEEHLFSPELDRFVRSIDRRDDGGFDVDPTVDASLFGAFYFGCFTPDNEMVVATMRAIEEKLSAGCGIGRFEHDGYMRSSNDFPGNPWFICTLWLADHYIAKADAPGDLERALEILRWTASNALQSGVLSEQLNPESHDQVSVSPLTWSHSTFVATVRNYLQKLDVLKQSD